MLPGVCNNLLAEKFIKSFSRDSKAAQTVRVAVLPGLHSESKCLQDSRLYIQISCLDITYIETLLVLQTNDSICIMQIPTLCLQPHGERKIAIPITTPSQFLRSVERWHARTPPPPPEKGQVQLWEQDTPKQYGDTSSDHMKWEAFGNVINMYKGTWVAV